LPVEQNRYVVFRCFIQLSGWPEHDGNGNMWRHRKAKPEVILKAGLYSSMISQVESIKEEIRLTYMGQA